MHAVPRVCIGDRRTQLRPNITCASGYGSVSSQVGQQAAVAALLAALVREYIEAVAPILVHVNRTCCAPAHLLNHMHELVLCLGAGKQPFRGLG